MTKRIAYLVADYPTLTETFIQREILALRDSGAEIEVHTLRNVVPMRALWNAVREPWKMLRLLVMLLKGGSRPRLRTSVGAVLRALTIYQSMQHPPPHIHAAFLGMPAVVAYCVSKLLDTSYSVSAHARDIYVESTPDIVLRDATFRTTCTETNRKFLEQKYPHAPFVLVRHGLDLRPYNTNSERKDDTVLRLLAVGRLVEKKGYPVLIRACEHLTKEAICFHCTIIGDGPDHASLTKLISQLDLADSISLLGARSHTEVISHLGKANILLVPSISAEDGDRDGIPNIVLEAMAARLPVIASDAGSITEIVRDMDTGLHSPQRDPKAMACAINRLISDPQLRQSIVSSAHRLIAHEYDPKVWTEVLRRLFCH